jgi:electron transport complex protein RnfC
VNIVLLEQNPIIGGIVLTLSGSNSVFDFAGGVHPPHSKETTEASPIEVMSPPSTVVIPLQQHIGAPCKVVVKVKDEVKRGQVVGEAGGFVSAPVHASISGVVTKVELRPHPAGGEVMSVVIESDGKDEAIEMKGVKDYRTLSPEKLREIIMKAGIVGMGGAAFPTHVKLTPPPGEKCEVVILNGAECEPYLTSDHREMLEHGEDVVLGLEILINILGANRGIIGIEDNKVDAIEHLRKIVADKPQIEVLSLKVKYPQGAELQLIKAALNREVAPGKLPIHEGVVVQNVGTAVAVVDAVLRGKPLYERIVTVTGNSVAEPKNLMVRVGTSFKDVLAHCGGFYPPPGKVISGGPMMGTAIKDLEVPVVKATSGILCLSESSIDMGAYSNCIKCARCVDACPMFIVPSVLGNSIEFLDYEKAEKLHVMDCKECGCCTFVCPAKRPLVHWFKFAKAKIVAARRKKKG